MTNLKLGMHVDKLCDQCLLGLHKEIHQEAGTLVNHDYGEAVVRGHYNRGQVDMRMLSVRHKQVKEEMLRRGMNHDSSFDYDITSTMTGNWYMEAINYEAVKNRCEDCKEMDG